MKLSMETMYLPEAKFHQKKEMMADWTLTSARVSNFSYALFVTAVIAAGTLRVFWDSYWFAFLGSAGLFLVGAVFSKRWKYAGYVAVLLGELLNTLRFYLDAPEANAVYGVAVAVAVFGLVPSYFAFRCIYNYRPVFKELEKSEGFPNFIANTADLYGDKLYMKDKEETIFESSREASYNPFNSEQDIREEEVRRYQNARVKAEKAPIEMDIDVKGRLVSAEEEKRKREETERKAKEGGVFIGSYELVFPHGDLSDNDFHQKRMFMGKWRENNEGASANFPVFTLLLGMGIMSSGFGSIHGIINFAVILIFVLATNQMKMGKWYAPVTMLIAVAYTCMLINSDISMIMVIASFAAGHRMFTGMLRYILNYKSYKLLSTQSGFPTFIKTTADLYGDKLYIVEKREPLKKKDLSQRAVKVMDIGYDNKPKKDEGAWNAFNYMDENKEENDKNEG